MDIAKYQAFIERVDQLSSGERAALRKACGRPLTQADAQAIYAFYKALENAISGRNDALEEAYFESACLRCMWRPEEEMEITAELALRSLAGGDGDDGLKRRMIALMDTRRDADGSFALKMWRMIRLLKSKGKAIDCAALINDIYNWDSDTRWVQRKWAKEFTQGQNQEEAEEGE